MRKKGYLASTKPYSLSYLNLEISASNWMLLLKYTNGNLLNENTILPRKGANPY